MNTPVPLPPVTETADVPVLRTTLKRGALLTAANWQIVLAQFAAESTFKLLLVTPLVGGALLVAVTLGGSLQELLRGDIREVAAATADALVAQPVALGAFLAAVGTVFLGGWVLVLYVKAGAVTVMVVSERGAGPVERAPLRTTALQRASCASIQTFVQGCSSLFVRYVTLGGLLFAAYLLSGALYVMAVVVGYRLFGGVLDTAQWTTLVTIDSAVLLVCVTLINLYYLLVQIVVAADNCGVNSAITRVARFLRHRTRAVGTVFAALLGFHLLATAISIVAAAGLGLIAFVPLAGLAVFPLQVTTWLVRALLFQFLGLTALGAYSTLYRSYVEGTPSVSGGNPYDMTHQTTVAPHNMAAS